MRGLVKDPRLRSRSYDPPGRRIFAGEPGDGPVRIHVPLSILPPYTFNSNTIMKWNRLLKLGLLACLCLSLTRCNVFEGFAEEASTVEDLSAEADVLLAKGEAAEAVKKLEEALQKAPQDKGIQVKLAVATMEANDIGVADLLQLANALNDLTSGTSSTAAPIPFGTTNHLRCTPPEAHDQGTVFNPSAIQIIQDIQSQLPVYNRIRELLNSALPALTPSTTFEQVRDALILAGLQRNQANEYTKAALLAQALTHLGVAMVNTFSIPGVTYKKLPSGSASGFAYGFCATNAAFANLCTTLTAPNTGTFALADKAITALQVRSQESNQSTDQDQIVTEARKAIDKVKSQVTCS